MATSLGDTPLHRSCYNGFVNLTELLLDFGASIFSYNKSNETPLDQAFKWKRSNSEHPGGEKLMKLLDESQNTDRDHGMFKKDPYYMSVLFQKYLRPLDSFKDMQDYIYCVNYE